MRWLLGSRYLRRLGILGMNRRNAACILDHNPRAAYPVVDDKLRMARLCEGIGVATPAVYATVERPSQLRRLDALLAGRGDLVVKPNRGSAGRGVLVLVGRAGVDLDAGVTCHAVQHNRFVRAHPDTGAALVGVVVPGWADVLGMARRVAAAVGLGYLGVDIVLDADAGPLLLEANARPGLAIQIANNAGLLPRLRAIDARLATPRPAPAVRVAA